MLYFVTTVSCHYMLHGPDAQSFRVSFPRKTDVMMHDSAMFAWHAAGARKA